MRNAFTEGQKARETLKIIETLTYTCDDGDALSDLNCKLNEALFQFKECIPSSEGIIVRPAIAQRTRLKYQIKRAERITQKYGSLQLRTKRGPKRLDAVYRNRVGKKASSLRKVRVFCLFLNKYNMTTLLGCTRVVGKKGQWTSAEAGNHRMYTQG